MSEEKYNEYDGKNKENDLNNSSEVVLDGQSSERGVDKQKLYKIEKQNIERGIEKSGEKLKQDLSVSTKNGDDEDEDQNNDSDSVDYYAQEIVKLDADDQVEHLVRIATNKSPYLAIEIAKHLQDNYVLAELHSDLTEEKVQQMLFEKGLL